MNKADEWKLLLAALIPGDADGATAHEAPDFLIPRRCGFLGMEVTEAFMSESHARMEVFPDYLGNLLKEGRYRHKKDKQIFPIKRVRYTAESGEPVDAIGVARINPSSKEKFSRLVEVIASKAKRVLRYQNNCALVDLIIHDRGIFAGTVTGEQIPQIFQQRELREEVQRCAFHEIHYVCKVETGGHFCYSVRAGILAEETLHFFSVIANEASAVSISAAGGALTTHLAKAGFRSVSVYEQNHQQLVIFCDVAVAVFDVITRHIHIYDLNSRIATDLKQDPSSMCSVVEGKPILDKLGPFLQQTSGYVNLARLISLTGE